MADIEALSPSSDPATPDANALSIGGAENNGLTDIQLERVALGRHNLRDERNFSAMLYELQF
jgi:hypothetical protein